MDFGQCAHRLRLVEVAREADLVAGLDAVGLVPGVERVGQDLAAQECLDAARLLQRNLLGVAQVGVRLVLHHRGRAIEGGFKQAAQRIGRRAALVNLPDDRRGVLSTFAALLQRLDLGGLVDAVGVDAGEAQRPLDRDLPVAEGGVVENPALLALLECQERVADAGDVVVAELAVLLAEVLVQGLVPLGGVDQLHLAAAVRRLAVGEHPDVGGDGGVGRTG